MAEIGKFIVCWWGVNIYLTFDFLQFISITNLLLD